MAPRASPKLYQYLPIALLLLLWAITAPARADHFFDINPNPSPEASTSLICPNDNPSDCYPALFQPTLYFQKIRPDQSLPPGLHVRLNIQTGEKEARLNVPEEGEDEREAVVVIDDVPQTGETRELGIVEDETETLQVRLQDGPKQAEHARQYTPPRPAGPVDPNEAVQYEEALSVLKREHIIDVKNPATHDISAITALETLTELAHSLEWGLAITRDVDLSRSLFAVVTNPNEVHASFRSAILLLMATAIQNNPEATSALLHHDHIGNFFGPLHATMVSLSYDANGGGDPTLISRAIFLLSQLCVDDGALSAYLTSSPTFETEGYSQLNHLFSASLSEKNLDHRKIRHRIANFMEDHAERIATLTLAGEEKADKIVAEEIRKYLEPWCGEFSIAMQKYEEGDLMGVMEAKRAVDLVLKTYTGVGCVGSVNADGPKEL